MYITDLRLRICAREKGGREIYKTEPKRAIIVRNFAATLHTAIASPRTLRYSRSVRKRRISWRSKAAASLDVLFPIEHTTIPFCHSQPWQQTIYILFGLYMFRIQKRVSCSFTHVFAPFTASYAAQCSSFPTERRYLSRYALSHLLE